MAAIQIELNETARKITSGKSVVLTDEIALLLNASNSSWVFLHDRIIGPTTHVGVYEKDGERNFFALAETINAVVARFK